MLPDRTGESVPETVCVLISNTSASTLLDLFHLPEVAPPALVTYSAPEIVCHLISNTSQSFIGPFLLAGGGTTNPCKLGSEGCLGLSADCLQPSHPRHNAASV